MPPLFDTRGMEALPHLTFLTGDACQTQNILKQAPMPMSPLESLASSAVRTAHKVGTSACPTNKSLSVSDWRSFPCTSPVCESVMASSAVHVPRARHLSSLPAYLRVTLCCSSAVLWCS
jgi:hypothetical protein